MHTPNLFDYVKWRGDLDFDRFPFNPVDNIIFSQLSYLPMDGIVPGTGEKGTVDIAAFSKLYAAKKLAGWQTPKEIMVDGAAAVLNSVWAAPRYEDCGLWGYENSTCSGEEKQFSAFCAVTGKKRQAKKLIVVFRGTDMSLVGWKEDFNMSFTDSVPAQKEAVRYIEKAAGRFAHPLIVAGHSKGGNLAVFAAAFCNEAVQRRIENVYSNDAPGFSAKVINSSGYAAVSGRIKAFVPQSSVVGMLFEHGVSSCVVKSCASGFMQHDLCTWGVEKDRLADGGELTHQSRIINGIIREWSGKINISQRQQFIEALYRILTCANINSFSDIGHDRAGAVRGIINEIKNTDTETKKLLGEIFGELFKTAGKNIMEQRHKG